MNRDCLPLLLLVAHALAALPPVAAENAPLPDALWLTYQRSVPSHLIVNWSTVLPQHSIVRFGTNETCEMQALLPVLQTLHQVEVPLPREAPFYYRLEIDGRLTEAVLFEGLPAEELRIAMVADWGFAEADVTALLRDQPHLLVSGGDQIMRLHSAGIEGDVAKSNLLPHLKLLQKYPELFRRIPFMPVLGNHDREIRPRRKLTQLTAPVYDIDAAAYRKIFPLPGSGWKWHFERPEFGLRLIGLDLNHVSDAGTLLQSCHEFRSGSEQIRWYAELMREENRAPFTITLCNEKSSTVRGLCQGEWGRLVRRGTLAATGFGYFGEVAEEQGFLWYNTSLNGRGDQYKDPLSKFVTAEDNYLLFRLRRGAAQMQSELKRLSDGQVLDRQSLNARARAARLAP